ncbi:Druantia anti-phage system protein DruA [Thermococcus barophilus]|uniref:Uncharacterized protein n=1 Tax=Thermococcus barophilus (strain DSM 11836 / MP) TaxID=391623 RepID=F0LI03_THEBM|nr:Druantia anti-phage system protein DruA [Thermococcus barophilus]ADT84403.1 hypothetical protein TERMP_01428 [Thermococcus barophilus MP]
MNEQNLDEIREKLISYFHELGFLVNPHLKPKDYSKDFLRLLHSKRRIEQLYKHKDFLEQYYPLIREYYKDMEINLEDIKLEVKFVERGTEEYILFKWWNLVWWSLPYEKSVGRRIYYMLFDKYHNLPFGLVVLQSPILYCKARDEYLGITKETRDYWINQSLYGQRIGALPPYNKIFGGKMVSMSLASVEIRKRYREKYKNKVTAKKKRILPARLLFIYTLSAYGRSKLYEDLYYDTLPLSIFVGYSSGAGTFHITDGIYKELLKILGENVNTSTFVSPSRKLKLVSRAFRILGLYGFEYHNIKRGVYLFPHVNNLREVINNNERPKWRNIKFENLFEHWLQNYVPDKLKRKKIKVSWGKLIKSVDYPFDKSKIHSF